MKHSLEEKEAPKKNRSESKKQQEAKGIRKRLPSFQQPDYNNCIFLPSNLSSPNDSSSATFVSFLFSFLLSNASSFCPSHGSFL